jgi:hypothetical protein
MIRTFLEAALLLLPAVLMFTACLLAMGSYEYDIIGLWIAVLAAALYWPCTWAVQYFSQRLTDQE